MSQTEIQVHIPDSISWTAYRALAARTEAPADGILQGCTDPRAIKFVRLSHALIGISTELDEIAELFTCTQWEITTFRAKLAEEIGDVCWYAVMLEEFLPAYMEKNSLRTLADLNIGTAMFELREQLELRRHFLDAGKRELMYSPTANAAKAQANAAVLEGCYDRVTRFMALLMQNNSLDLGRICATNIRKLLIRYSKKFDSQEAFDRDLEAEFKLLYADSIRPAQS